MLVNRRAASPGETYRANDLPRVIHDGDGLLKHHGGGGICAKTRRTLKLRLAGSWNIKIEKEKV
jgi:hypothetical protein